MRHTQTKRQPTYILVHQIPQIYVVLNLSIIPYSVPTNSKLPLTLSKIS